MMTKLFFASGPLLYAVMANAATIDLFTDTMSGGPTIITETTVGGAPVFEPMINDVIGGERITLIEGVAFDAPGIDEVRGGIFPSAGVFDYSNTAGATGKASLVYRNTDGPDGLDADISGDGLIRIELTHYNFASGIPMAVSVTLDDGINAATLNKSVTVPGAQTLDFLFSDFPTGDFALLDTMDIDRIDVVFNPGQSTDFRISSLTTEVPEPASAVLLLAGAMGLASRRRSRRAD